MDITVIIDNYDSFVYNIAQYVGELGSRPIVVRNDEVTVKAIERMRPDRIILSPGPGSPTNPRDVGICPEVVKHFQGRVPILGICLGHQVIGYIYGAKIRHARTIKHGKLSKIRIIAQSPLFRGIPEELTVMRYHSLVICDPPPCLKVTAVSLDDNEIMAIEHVEYPIFGVQFHPESVLTEFGKRILKNFIDIGSPY